MQNTITLISTGSRREEIEFEHSTQCIFVSIIINVYVHCISAMTGYMFWFGTHSDDNEMVIRAGGGLKINDLRF